MAFVRRLLTFTFTLGPAPGQTGKPAQGQSVPTHVFAESGTNTVTLPPLRATAKIVKAGTPSLGEAQIQIFGMTLSLMNQLSTLGQVIQLIPRNTVTVQAGDEGGAMSTVFVGTVLQAWADFDAAPTVPFYVVAHTLGAETVATLAPTSVRGSADVAGIMQGLAGAMNCTFENSGVNAKLSNPYFYGSPRWQANACAEHAGISWFVDDTTLAIWPKNGSRNGDAPLISPETGLVGYPSFMNYGLALKTIFNPLIRFGAKVQVQSSLKPACGEWVVNSLSHDLSTQMPKGDWFSSMTAYNPKFPTPIASGR